MHTFRDPAGNGLEFAEPSIWGPLRECERSKGAQRDCPEPKHRRSRDVIAKTAGVLALPIGTSRDEQGSCRASAMLRPSGRKCLMKPENKWNSTVVSWS